MKHVSYELRSKLVVPIWVFFAEQQNYINSDIIVFRNSMQAYILDCCNPLAKHSMDQMYDELK